MIEMILHYLYKEVYGVLAHHLDLPVFVLLKPILAESSLLYFPNSFNLFIDNFNIKS